ncbi:unnamed protein product [Cochlearia groenlandica]
MADVVQYAWILYLFKKLLWLKAVNMLTGMVKSKSISFVELTLIVLDFSYQYFMSEESVCLLLRASWFQPLEAVDRVSYNGNDEDDIDEFYLHDTSLRLGNRRWGDNGFVRLGRQEVRPVQHKRGD